MATEIDYETMKEETCDSATTEEPKVPIDPTVYACIRSHEMKIQQVYTDLNNLSRDLTHKINQNGMKLADQVSKLGDDLNKSQFKSNTTNTILSGLLGGVVGSLVAGLILKFLL